MITLWRIFVTSWKHLARNLWIALATIFVFMMALLSVNVLLGVNAMLEKVVTLLEEKVDMTVAFKPTAPDAILQQARFYLTSLPQIKSVSVISPEQVLADFKLRHAQDPKILSALRDLPANPLGAQLIIHARQPDDYAFLAQAIQSPQYAAFIQSQTYNDHQSAIARVHDVSRQVRIVGSVLVAVFALFGLLIAFNAIRVAIYTQREEISIMRLVGASAAFIRGPFVLEGLWLAMLSLISSGAIIYSTVLWLEPILTPLFGGSDAGLQFFFVHQWSRIVLMEGVGLIGLVMIMSWLAVGKYIKR
ncbi:FtsX-like permease family protein [Candidatus Uhrbacteria bacterium]|nr:FtsX-like permease family protein [Candidatus Uhrbacteria bacterium]